MSLLGIVSVKAENKNPGMSVAKGAMAKVGAPIVAMAKAVIGTPKTMPASIRRLVSMGNSLTMLMVLVIMSLLSTSVVALSGGLLYTWCRYC